MPVSAGNYSYIDLNDKAIYIMSRETGIYANSNIKVLSISNEDIKLNDMASDVSGFELTRDGKKNSYKKRKVILYDKSRYW
ncbi:MAG: hypothetical protein CM15mP75_0910 [Flammeovirgaceae bacterium]|nr:MAG: hypothetical protein CM15mP75_0910 [Flammeovirgaceae bacterium]